MSVPEGKRKDGKLEAFVKAQELAAYTIQITSNPKKFPPQYDSKITNRLVDCAVSIYEKSWQGNNVMVKTHDDWEERSKLQKESILLCNSLITYIGIAKSVFHIRDKRIKNWTDMTMHVRALLRLWRESDVTRYKNI